MYNRFMFDEILEFSIRENDAFLYKILSAQMKNPTSWSEFWINIIKGLSKLNKNNQQELLNLAFISPPPPIFIHKDQVDKKYISVEDDDRYVREEGDL